MGIGENVGEAVGENTGQQGAVVAEDIPPGPGPNLLEDGWESGDMSTTNSDGFSWGANNRTSIVTMNAACSTPGQPVAIYNNNVICNEVPGSDWTAKTGDNSLRVRYPADTSWAEQRFDLGVAQRELWCRYWIRVPTNFKHRSGTGSGPNQKWFIMWMDFYEGAGDGSTVYWQTWADGSNGSTIAINHTDGNFSGSGGTFGNTAFISYPDDQGRWMQCVYRLVTETSPGAGNGILQFWRKWEGGSFVQIHSFSGLTLAVPDAGPDGWKVGYLMGWSSPLYDVETEWLIDDFALSTESLLP